MRNVELNNPFAPILLLLILQPTRGDFFDSIGQNRKSSLRANVVRFTPVSDRIADIPDWQLRATSGLMQCSKTAVAIHSFNHLVGAGEQYWVGH